MAWRELAISPVPRGLVQSVSQVLFAQGASGVQEDHLPGQRPPPRQPWDTGPPPPVARQLVLRSWFDDADEDRVSSAIRELLGSEISVTWSGVEEQDWETAWQENFQPIRISDALTIAPVWSPLPGAILIEPGQGFGTGQHETTLAALHVIDTLSQREGITSALDIGCGSGILALATTHLGIPSRGVDIDVDALANARHNATLNGLTIPFDDTPVSQLSEPADLVMANLFAEALVGMSTELVHLCRQHLLLAGILVEREHMVRDVFDPVFGEPNRQVDGEWVCLHYVRSPA